MLSRLKKNRFMHNILHKEVKTAKAIYFLIICVLITSCASEKYVHLVEYDSLQQCRASAEGEKQSKIKTVLEADAQNLFFYSWERIVDNSVNFIDLLYVYNEKTKKWSYTLAGFIEINYRYKHGILSMPGNCGSVMIWSGNSRNKRVFIKDIP